MSRRWLLSLLCLSVLFLSLVPLTRARGEVKVDERGIRFLLEKEPAEVLLAVENSSGETLAANVKLEILDPQDRVISLGNSVRAIGTGKQRITLSLPLFFSKLKQEDRRHFLWQRLHYQLTGKSGSEVISEGIVSLSEITPDLFELRVAAPELAREGTRYSARVLARHPLTHKPAANVLIDAELNLVDDSDKGIKLHNSSTTDQEGYAVLDFVMPKRFPQFPHTTHPSGGEFHVVGRRGAFVAEAEGNALVDQFTKTLITTDKPLYQPGQIMHLRALVLTPSRRALANQNILFKIKDPEGTAVYRTAAKSSRFGIASADWNIPENVRLGDYRIHVAVEGGNEEDEESSETMYDVRISRYDLPNFSVSVQTDRDYYLPGENAEVRVRADYLFGQPVRRGQVRVVRETEREWNYREQKWDVEEGDKYDGKTDANGQFVTEVNLSNDHKELSDRDYSRFEDISYAAYFTDPTTNRTEQRRFNLRVSKESIHVYVITENYRNRKLPLKFYVSTSYADGLPARCKLHVAISNRGTDSSGKKQEIVTKQLLTLRTNRYGVAKVSGLRIPSGFDQQSELDLIFSASDASGRKGKRTQNLNLDDYDMTYVETDKALYRAGEPIIASISSTFAEEPVVVDLVRNSTVIHSERVRLHNGRGLVTIPYKPAFSDMLTIAAYRDFPKRYNTIETQTVLYPRNVELQVKARTSQTTYRPGENARLALDVRAPEGKRAESALGVVVSDKAVAERFRTTQEFGGSYGTYNESLERFMGLDLNFAGVTLRDLQRLNTAKNISPDLDLVAEVLLNQSRGYYPNFFGGDQYETAQREVFEKLVEAQIKPAKEALARHYLAGSQYPTNEATLRRLLSEDKVDLSRLLDPWGVAYQPVFSAEGPSDVLTFNSAGADKRFGTDDDFAVERFSWRYFLPLGAIIDRAIREHHKRTGGFIRDLSTLREELTRAGVSADQLRDRWGQPYRFDFGVNQTNYVLTISSGGPDRTFSENDNYRFDDFEIWHSAIDYFAESRARIENLLNENLKATKMFPLTAQELDEALHNSGSSLETLHDPWSRPYFTTFKIQSVYTDRAQLENRVVVGGTSTTRVNITPVTQRVAIIELRSMGKDGELGTPDDFSVAIFRGVLSEQAPGDSAPHVTASQVILSGSNGAIQGIVTDELGASIPRAKVTAIQPVPEKHYETLSDEEGKFVIADLPPGFYEVHFEAPGFMKQIFTNVLVSVSGITQINASLRVGAITETVSVMSDAGPGSFATDQSVNAGRSTFSRGQVQIVTKSGVSAITTPRLREYFPETLLWQPSIETDKQGRAQINFKLADNITTWKLAVIGSTEDGLIGTTETEIKSFQPFFVEHEPPRILTEGDEISLPVVVRNYLQRNQKVDLELKPERWFSLLGPARRETTVSAGDASRETFKLRAVASVKDGKQRITATAADGNDAIEKPVTVHPDGEEMSVAVSDILGSSATLELNLPEDMIPNSSEAEVKVYPNLMAHVVESIEAIMSRPYGCGEQVISSTYPSLLLLRHLKSSGKDSPLRARAERYLSLGYSKLLNYRDESGGFTYWGRGRADQALTAYALRLLTEAGELSVVDKDVIDEAQGWLIKQQLPDGSWRHDNWNDRESSRRSAMLTAYIARVLALAGGEASKEKAEALKRSFDYLDRRAAEIDEPYLLASYALAALATRDTDRAKPIVEKLGRLAHQEGGGIYWSLETNTPFYGWGLAGRVETTALVVQALNRFCDARTDQCESDERLVAGALLFLLKQKDRYGVWYSTQATINVLDAMLSMLDSQSPGQNNKDTQATAEIFVNERSAETIKMPASANSLVSPISVDISKLIHLGKNTIRIKRPEGSPFASVQALASFYEPWPDRGVANKSETRANDLRLQAKCDKTEGKVGDEFNCHVEVERIAFRGYGMMLAEIGVPPGADVDRSSLETAMKGSGWAIDQYDILPDRVVVYLWPSAGGVKFDFKFRPRFGLNAKSAASVLYDYYNPEARAVVPPVAFKIKEK